MGSLSGDSARILGEVFPKIYCDHETGPIFLWCLSLTLEINVSFPTQGSGAQIHISTHHPVVLATWITTSPGEIYSLCRKKQKIKWTPSGWVGVYLYKPVLWKFTSGKKKSHSEKIYTCPTTQLQFMAKMYLIWLSLWSFSSIKPFKINYTTSTATLPWRDGLTHPSSAWNLRSCLWVIIPWFSNCL